MILVFLKIVICDITPLKNQIFKDIRDISYEDLNGVDYVIHLAALSNDPLGELTNLTNEINYLSTKKIANLSKQNGVRRFVYVSSQVCMEFRIIILN